jgi:hypothetical protein
MKSSGTVILWRTLALPGVNSSSCHRRRNNKLRRTRLGQTATAAHDARMCSVLDLPRMLRVDSVVLDRKCRTAQLAAQCRGEDERTHSSGSAEAWGMAHETGPYKVSVGIFRTELHCDDHVNDRKVQFIKVQH